MSRIRIYIISSILLFLALSEFIFLKIIPSILDLNKYSSKISELIKTNNAVEAKFQGLSLNTFADFSIAINADAIEFSTEKQQLVSSRKTHLRFYILPLLVKHLNIKSFEAKDLNILIVRDKNGLYSFNKIKFPQNFDNIDIKISNAKIDLSGYNIYFTDNFYKNSYHLNGKKFYVNNFKQNKKLDLALNGTLAINNKTSFPIDIEIKTKLPIEKHLDEKGLKLNIELKDFDLKILQDYAREYFDKTLKDMSGILDVNIKTKNNNAKNNINLSANIDNFKYLRKNADMSVLSDGKLEILSDFIASDKNLQFENFKLTGNDININAKGGLRDYTNLKNIKTDLNISIKNSRSDKLYWLAPSEIPTDFDMIRKVKNYGFFADVNGDLKIKGKGMTPDVLGKIDITHAYVTKPFAEHVPKADIFLEFIGQKVNINNRSFTDKEEFVDVTGNVELYGKKNADLHIVSTKNVDLISTYQVIIPVHDVFGFELGPVPEMTFYKGAGSIDLYTKGNIEDPHLEGFFECHNTDTSLKGLNAKLINTSAKMDFLDENYHFYTTDAKENSYPIEIDGTGDWSGKFDFNVTAKDLSAAEGVKILSESDIFEDYNKSIKAFKDVSGIVDAFINLKGKVDVFTIENIKNNIKYSAKIIAKNVGLKMNQPNAIITEINGETRADDTSFISKLKGFINNAPFNIEISSDMKNVTTKGDIKNFRPEVLLSKDENISIKTISAPADIIFSYRSPLDKIYYDKLVATVKFKAPDNQKNAAININQGNIIINKGDLKFEALNIKSYSSVMELDGKIKDIFSRKPVYDIKSDIKKFEIRDIAAILAMMPIQTSDINNLQKILRHFSGNITGNVEYSKNKLNGNLAMNGIIIKTPRISQSVVIGNTNLKITNNNLELTPFTFNFYKVPIFLKLNITSIMKNPRIYLYSTSKITSSFLDEFLNNYLTYPVKLKGETNFSTTIQGNLNSPEVFASLKVPQNSDLSYMGANMGDTFDDREIYFNAIFEHNKINLKHLAYKKYINTQHNRAKPLQILGVTGTLNKSGNEYILSPIYIKTNNPINAGFFNMIFKKSIIKSGNVECNLKITGKAQAPFIIGNLRASNVDMPSFNAKIRDLDVDLSPAAGDLRLRANAYDSELEINSLFKNSVKMPVEIYNIDISSKYVNLDNIFDSITKINYSDYSNKRNDNINDVINNFLLPVVTIKKGTLTAENVLIKGLNAQNTAMNFSIDKNMLLKIDDFIFNLAKGTVWGTLTYNLKNTNLKASAQAKNVSAQPVVKALFMLDNQIFGNLNGKIDINTSGYNDEQKTKNLSGNVSFEIIDGKMPKLGSLEYLLHAANLIENGITGMSINSILQILMPLRTGDFTKLTGSFKIKEGIAKDIQIYSNGKSLNLYLTGSIDLLSSIAKMEIWGKLDSNIKTPLGVIGNASLNSLFGLIPWINLDDPQNAPLVKNLNKIPGIELHSKKIRIFRAVINGDISSDKFVEKFEWVKN